MKVVLATRNPGKLKELKELAKDAPELEFVLAPPAFDPQETGQTFMENAIIKAKAAATQTGLHALADDSGLVVEALCGAPGIHSARYCEGDDAARRRKLLGEMSQKESEDPRAAFVCAMAFCAPDGQVLHTAEANWQGVICCVERGNNGFGYDPIFLLPEKGLTAAQLASSEKNQISHRAQAFRKMLEHMKNSKLY